AGETGEATSGLAQRADPRGAVTHARRGGSASLAARSARVPRRPARAPLRGEPGRPRAARRRSAGMKYLLDTCVLSDFARGDARTLARVTGTPPELLAVSSVTVTEIEYGL